MKFKMFEKICRLCLSEDNTTLINCDEELSIKIKECVTINVILLQISQFSTHSQI